MLKRAFHDKINDNYIIFLNKTNDRIYVNKSLASYIKKMEGVVYCGFHFFMHG